jgi:uncharacterized damage-inducible protein DinB
VNVADIRFLLGYDRWATRKVLDAMARVPDDTWGATGVVGDRGLGGIVVHQLGAHQRWRNALAQSGLEPEPEREPLPSAAALVDAWELEWATLDAWLESVTDDWLQYRHEGVALWQMLAHLVNHGTQHRAEAAAILTSIGLSPGELDMIFYAEELAGSPG